MTSHSSLRPHVVVGIDHPETARSALEWAVEEARRRGAVLRAIMAWQADSPPLQALFGPMPFEVRQRARARLAEALHEVLGSYPDLDVESRVAEGDPTQVLYRATRDADLLVLGGHRHGALAELLLGSVSSRYALLGQCPVVVVPAGSPVRTPRTLCVGFDGSPASAGALDWALGEALRTGGTIHVVNAWQPPPAPVLTVPLVTPALTDVSTAEEAADALVRAALTTCEHSGVPATGETIRGSARSVLTTVARTYDLLVVGDRQHHRLAGEVLGSVAQSCIRHAMRPVVVVPSRYAATRGRPPALVTPGTR